MTSPAFVFDAYGTLFDVHAAIGRHRAAAGPDAERLSELWRTKQLEYSWTLTLAGRYEDFWTLTGRALDFALARFPAVDRALKPTLMEAYRTLDAFADARAILHALKTRGHPTAILSNGSPAMLSAAPIRMYKPRPEAYRLVTDHFGIAAGDVIFVSSNRWDVMGASAFGFRAAWINRAKMPDEYPDLAPERVLTDLGGLMALAGPTPNP
jgi:2-haloacid dehalogenase